MGENDTAALDPIFYFHHCFIDYVFWAWQRRNGFTDDFSIDLQDPGSYYNGDSPPPAGANPGDQLTMATPLLPFTRADGSCYVSSDCVNIESQLGYTYGQGSLDAELVKSPLTAVAEPKSGNAVKSLRVSGLDRSRISGSFIIAAYAPTPEGAHQLIGVDAVLSRWTVQGCANCQSRLRVSSAFPIAASLADDAIKVVVHTRQGAAVSSPQGPVEMVRPMLSAGQLSGIGLSLDLPFKVEIV